MKHEPRPAIHMEKPLLTGVSWMGLSLRGSPGRVGQTVVASLMEYKIRHPPASAGALWEDGSEKEQWPLPPFLFGRRLSSSSGLDASHFSSSLYATGSFQDATPVLELGVNLSKSMFGFFKGNCLGLQEFILLTQSPLVFAARSCRGSSFWHWNPGLGFLVWGRDSSSLRCPS